MPALPPSAEPFLLGYGVLGFVVLGLITGWLNPKWVADEYRKRIAIQDALISQLADHVRRLADRLEDRP